MSRQRVTEHLNDLMHLSQWLLESFSSMEQTVTRSLLSLFLRKQQQIQLLVKQLLQHQQLEQRVVLLRSQIAEVDAKISQFASKLGIMEKCIHESLSADTSGIERNKTDCRNKQQLFNVHQIMVFAERLGLMSMAPADYVDNKGMSLCRPPAPLEDLMSASRLHFTLDELVKLSGEQTSSLSSSVTVSAANTLPSSIMETTKTVDEIFDVPDDWDEDASDFEVEDIAQLWSRQRAHEQSLHSNP